MKFTTTVLAAILGTAVYGAALPDPNCRFPGMPCSRDAEADPGWQSGFRRLPGQPIGKREAEPEADPEADPNCRFPGMPCSRNAEADPGWHSGFRRHRLPGQPIGKREAEAEAEAEPAADPEADPNCRFPGMPCS
ncbi:hypothetical protein P171DRAFT_447204 [Karstenula rhodostoma CBS 690.94]|uniref:Uncharacterized protein n=1 Tax=Karstenula rhodostoma CBS 690.94 TaxID=1392251 RepID=A0A9P4PAD8_9PLEO|nr:hypothetical protein P171DRAFT_447204 [Karstenula rhodostoma CBS 690.94]